ncbi:MAG: PEGA domain-containing protein [Treponema sp.]|nr:PEGA domain-containing protein [Treponema sp.]
MKSLKKFSVYVLTLSVFLLSVQTIYAESFRVRKAHIIQLNNDNTEIIAKDCNIYDAVAIYLPEDKSFIPFLEGIEIKMVIPESIVSWPNSVAATVYDRICPEPSAKQIDYSGTRLYVNTLPPKLSWVLQVPLVKNHSIKESKYSSLITTIPSNQATNLFLKFQPVMKGIPEEVTTANIQVSARPILADKGRLKLNLKLPEPSKTEETNTVNSAYAVYSIYIDDIPTNISSNSQDIILGTGVHNISLISENYRNEVRTFYIEQAKTTNLDIELKGVEPTLIINAPDGVKISFDGQDYSEKTDKEFVISEGDHSIRFEIGSYEVVKSINAVKGKTYKASLDVDLSITEN